MTNELSGAGRTPIAWADMKLKGGKIMAVLNALPADVAGPDILTLADRIWNRAKGQHSVFADVVPDEHRAAFEDEVQALMNQLKKIVAAAPREGMRQPEPGAFVSVVQTWRGSIDPVVVAGLRLLGPDRLADANILADVYRLLTGIKMPKPQPKQGGRREVMDALFHMAREVVAYRDEHGLSYDSKWKTLQEPGREKGSPLTDSECFPVSETAQLYCTIVDAFGLKVANATLARILDSYLRELQADGRGPNVVDLILVDQA